MCWQGGSERIASCLWIIGGTSECRYTSARATCWAIRTRYSHVSAIVTAARRSRPSSEPPAQSSSTRQRCGPSLEKAKSRQMLSCDTAINNAISLAYCLASHSTAPSFSRLTATSTSNTFPWYTAQLAPPPMFLHSSNRSVARASTANCSCTTRARPPDAPAPDRHS